MTRKEYETVAKVLKNSDVPEPYKRIVTNQMAIAFHDLKPSFDINRFLKAAGRK